MMIEAFVQQLTIELGILHSIETDSIDTYLLPVDDNISIEIYGFPGGFSLKATMEKIPEHHCEDFFLEVLSSNLFGQGTGGGILGINENEALIITITITTDINYQEFRDLVEDFANYVDFWQSELALMKKEA
jgi:hypothetical protein